VFLRELWNIMGTRITLNTESRSLLQHIESLEYLILRAVETVALLWSASVLKLKLNTALQLFLYDVLSRVAFHCWGIKITGLIIQ
jgi:hypothetical protein